MNPIHFTGWLGWIVFAGLVYFSYWMRCTDDGLEFSKDNRLLLNLIPIASIAYVLFKMVWSVTQGFTLNPLK